MLAHKKPTSPTESASTCLRSGVKMPTSSISAVNPVPIARIFIRPATEPSRTRTSDVTPR